MGGPLIVDECETVSERHCGHVLLPLDYRGDTSPQLDCLRSRMLGLAMFIAKYQRVFTLSCTPGVSASARRRRSPEVDICCPFINVE